ncbi:hypothetical protein H9P43_007771 [Blastocladiella emersonii ATCC 22665]|nr:hypothetical protein H9P43_007771 [Blastocladiella emersonii ATCC 22665]
MGISTGAAALIAAAALCVCILGTVGHWLRSSKKRRERLQREYDAKHHTNGAGHADPSSAAEAGRGGLPPVPPPVAPAAAAPAPRRTSAASSIEATAAMAPPSPGTPVADSAWSASASADATPLRPNHSSVLSPEPRRPAQQSEQSPPASPSSPSNQVRLANGLVLNVPRAPIVAVPRSPPPEQQPGFPHHQQQHPSSTVSVDASQPLVEQHPPAPQWHPEPPPTPAPNGGATLAAFAVVRPVVTMPSMPALDEATLARRVSPLTSPTSTLSPQQAGPAKW